MWEGQLDQVSGVKPKCLSCRQSHQKKCVNVKKLKKAGREGGVCVGMGEGM